ncbi:MAG: hypothetical protein ACOC0A_01990, partial [Planctomycetota bacterium]
IPMLVFCDPRNGLTRYPPRNRQLAAGGASEGRTAVFRLKLHTVYRDESRNIVQRHSVLPFITITRTGSVEMRAKESIDVKSTGDAPESNELGGLACILASKWVTRQSLPSGSVLRNKHKVDPNNAIHSSHSS